MSNLKKMEFFLIAKVRVRLIVECCFDKVEDKGNQKGYLDVLQSKQSWKLMSIRNNSSTQRII